MSLRQLRELLGSVTDPGELLLVTETGELLVVTTAHGDPLDELLDAWRSARDECSAAYDAWRQVPRKTAHAVYQAAADREDAAQDALAAAWREAHS